MHTKISEKNYIKLHHWVRKNKPKVELCEMCGKKKKLDLANISGKYKKDINDYEWLCRSCHKIKDTFGKKKFVKKETTRKNIHLVTFKKVEDFLKKQKKPMFKSDIARQIKVDYNSLKMALSMLPIKEDKDGKIYLKEGKDD